ncbi:hypothetical protein CEXT_561441 [Caerostris extrusa]|uniref:Uncharacterized protein n=1 Tax=Caerostris extrusa TaxID=172846 RepID=A0AAV4WKW7_CAEEX|nr:hypothetical protein CEXT_561441 [Caerostris extrusa]
MYRINTLATKYRHSRKVGMEGKNDLHGNLKTVRFKLLLQNRNGKKIVIGHLGKPESASKSNGQMLQISVI